MKRILCLLAGLMVLSIGVPVPCEASAATGARGGQALVQKAKSGPKPARHQKKKLKKKLLKKKLKKAERKKERKAS